METGTNLRLGLMIRVFSMLAVVFVIALAIAPVESAFTDWRDVQERYNDEAAAIGAAPIEPAIQQIWNEDLGVVDRCASCHVGMGDAEPIPGSALFAAHPEIPHDPAEFGCTLCHSGQGRATKAQAAHGRVKHWEEPMLAPEHTEAGCGGCHSGLYVGSLELADRGRDLFLRSDCLACHRLDGRGGGRLAPKVAPDLSGIGLRDVPEDWHVRHLERQAADPEALIAEAYGPLSTEEVAAITEYLRTLAAMPRVGEGKRLFHEFGCRGCHAVNGVGGAEGADLTEIGKKQTFDLVFPANFRGERTVAGWHVAHLLAPGEVVAGSLMPDQGLTPPQAEKIALYLLSLRKASLPAKAWGPDRVRVDSLGERDFGSDGATILAGFCSGCHGKDGDGIPHGREDQAYPAIAGPDLLATASDAFLRRTIEKGRAGRRMQGFGEGETALRPAEIRALVSWLRSRQPAPPSFEAVSAATANADLGKQVYLDDCAVCHGAEGEGGIGPSHTARAFGELADDEFVYTTLTDGRPGTAMPRFREYDAATLESLIRHVRGLSAGTGAAGSQDEIPGDARRGRSVFEASCAGCHGEAGRGGLGPALGKIGFRRAAGSGFAVLSHIRGRCTDPGGDPAPTVGERDAADAVAYAMREALRPESALPGRRVQGDPAAGALLFARHCAPCHGEAGEGGTGPSLANPSFLAAANDDFLRASIIRGRRGTPMPRFDRDQPGYPRLSASEVDDIVTYLRSLAGGGSEGE